MSADLLFVVKQTFKFLTFQRAKIDLKNHKTGFLTMAIGSAWLAGLGRYWDHPNAYSWQYAGLGSVAYIFVLAAILWALIYPLRPKNWSYLSILVFIGLTSPLAWLYAIPVERFMSSASATSANIWFLFVVAAWRVALYRSYLKNSAKLSGIRQLAALLAPLALIIIALSALNLEHAVFEIMAGIDRTPTERDQIYANIVVASMFTTLAAPVIFLIYIGGLLDARKSDSDT